MQQQHQQQQQQQEQEQHEEEEQQEEEEQEQQEGEEGEEVMEMNVEQFLSAECDKRTGQLRVSAVGQVGGVKTFHLSTAPFNKGCLPCRDVTYWTPTSLWQFPFSVLRHE